MTSNGARTQEVHVVVGPDMSSRPDAGLHAYPQTAWTDYVDTPTETTLTTTSADY